MDTGAADNAAITDLAAAHDLTIRPETISVNELGLDFRVAIAAATDGQEWVLRIPRRADVTERAIVEGRLLSAVAPRVDVAVPDWRVHTPELIAYPLLPGEPGLSISADGTPEWHFDVESQRFATSLGDFLAQLHAVPAEEVADTGVETRTPAESRQAIRDDIAKVSAEFEVSPDLLERWRTWLADDRYWPEWSTLTHGEIYPAHLLLTGEEIIGVLDWTTASIGDPAKDFLFHRATVSDKAFDATVKRYVERGGRVWPMLSEHCVELYSTSAVNYGIYALVTGAPEHREAAAAQLRSPSA
ncbi:macrolide 2'-phosphotransferase MphH [Tessaracoccus terricola]